MKMRHWVFFLMQLCFFASVYPVQPIALKKVHFHEGATKGAVNAANIELGNMLLYFDNAPRIESSVVDKGGTTLHVIFLPNVSPEADAQKDFIDIAHRAKAHSCSVRFAQKNDLRRKGLEIALVYPSNSVGVRCDQFKTMKLQRGVRLQLYNKKLLHRIKQVGKNIITTAALKPPRVFIDCGHGGVDYGAICNTLNEKDLTLAIGLNVAQQLKKKGVQVCLSRDHDCTLSLDRRTSLANKQAANIFVSIHANATTNANAHGIETYFFHTSTFSEIASDVSTKNHALVKSYSDTCNVERCERSSALAKTVHNELLKTVRSGYQVHDRQIKLAPFQVLLGTQMPAVLVEVGFITHPQESRLLLQKKYQDTLATGITSGIMNYLRRA